MIQRSAPAFVQETVERDRNNPGQMVSTSNHAEVENSSIFQEVSGGG